MKIKTFYLHEAGPFSEGEISLVNDWTGSIADKVLFSGPNGCGKSTILRMVAMLWSATGYWLDKRKPLLHSSSEYKWLQRFGGVAVVLDDLPLRPGRRIKGFFPDEWILGLFFGDTNWHAELADKHPEITWFGESIQTTGKRGKPKRKLIQPGKDIMEAWSTARKSMIITSEKAMVSNVIYLDAEERRWVPPLRNVGTPIPDDQNLRWLTTYRVNEDWKGQLEAALINLKIVESEKKYNEVIRELNKFLAGKKINPKVNSIENRLRVDVNKQRSTWHYLDELSAGEHQVLILIFMLSRCLEHGGIVLIDEPDLYLHPSLIPGLLSRLEGITEKREGQFVITSHIPEVWERYESRGMRIRLGGAL